MQHARAVVLVSGSGTLLQALLDAGTRADYPVRVVAVGADRNGTGGVAKAESAGIPGFTAAVRDFGDRQAWDTALAGMLAEYQPDVVVSAGFMKILGPAVLGGFAGRLVNTHPALLPAFPGAHAVRDALAYGVRVTGATVHLVDSGVDTGPILEQEAVRVSASDDEGTLHERIKRVERRLLVDVVAELAGDGYRNERRKVTNS